MTSGFKYQYYCKYTREIEWERKKDKRTSQKRERTRMRERERTRMRERVDL